MSSASSSTPPIKRACDACHRRKVRCNGANPCQNCLHASLACTYNKPPQKKGPKGSRAKVISELRKSQEGQAASVLHGGDESSLHSPRASPGWASRQEILSTELVDSCSALYADRLYPILPILPRLWLQQHVQDMNGSAESFCLVGALCVLVLVQLGFELPLPSSHDGRSPDSRKAAMALAVQLVDEVRRTRSQTDFSENPTTATIIVSLFLSLGLSALQRPNLSWYYVQEAITLAKLLRIHDEKSYRAPGPFATINRRLFWLLFVAERVQALKMHRDLSLRETIEFPQPEADQHEDAAAFGVWCLGHMYRIVDSNLSEIWNTLRTEHHAPFPPNVAIWLAQLQHELTEAVPPVLKCTESQSMLIRVSQQWLRTLLWQLSTASGCLSSTASNEAMTFRYPLQIAGDLAAVTRRSSPAAIEAHGAALIEKIFDIAYVLADVIALVPIEPSSITTRSRDDLSHFLHLMTSLRSGELRFVRILEGKIREGIPDLAASLNLSAPPSAASTVTRPSGLSGFPSGTPLDSSRSSASSTYSSSEGFGSLTHVPPGTMGFSALSSSVLGMSEDSDLPSSTGATAVSSIQSDLRMAVSGRQTGHPTTGDPYGMPYESGPGPGFPGP